MHYGVVCSCNDLALTRALGVNSSDEKWNGVESYNFNGNDTMNSKATIHPTPKLHKFQYLPRCREMILLCSTSHKILKLGPVS